jgi:hypothetical protein
LERVLNGTVAETALLLHFGGAAAMLLLTLLHLLMSTVISITAVRERLLSMAADAAFSCSKHVNLERKRCMRLEETQ